MGGGANVAKLMRVPSRRFLFIQTRHKGTLVPIYITVLGLLALGLMGLLAVAWLPPPGSAARSPADRGPADNSRSYEGSYLPPPAPPKPPGSGTWM